MPVPKKQEIQFRYYEIPANTYILPLLGQKWIQNYGKGIDSLHFHNHLEIGYCYSGRGELVLNDTSNRFQSHMFSFIPPNFPHTTNSDPDDLSRWEFLFVDVEDFLKHRFNESARKGQQLYEKVYEKAHFFSLQDYPELAGYVITILTEARERRLYYQERMEAALLALLIGIARINSTRELVKKETVSAAKPISSIRPALDYISKEYAGEIHISDLAELCCISETHFRRLFQEDMHMTPVAYLNSVRIHMACAMLKKTDDSIWMIAMKTGFPTLSTFNRNFKKLLGISPYEWRNNPEQYERKLLNFKIKTYEGW